MPSRSVTDPRVEQRVRQVDGKVHEHVHGREDQRDALDDRVVAAQDRIDRQSSHAGYREDGLGDDRASDQRGEAYADGQLFYKDGKFLI